MKEESRLKEKVIVILLLLILTSFIMPSHRYSVHYTWIHHEPTWGYKEDGGYLTDSIIFLRHKNDTIKLIIKDHL